MMKLMGIGGRVILVFVLSGASILLTLFITVNNVESYSVESADALSAQIELLKQQLVSPGQDTHLRQIAALQEQQRFTLQQGSRGILLTAVVSCVMVGLLLWLFFRQQLVKPLNQLASVARRLQSDDTEVSIPHVNRTDDVGALASALGSFKAQCLSARESQQSVEPSQEERERKIHEQTQREQDRERSQAREHELEEALAQAQVSVASEAELQRRIQQLAESVIVAGTGNLSLLSKKLEREQRQDDPLGRTVRDLGQLFAQFDRDFVSINTGAGQLVDSATHLEGLGESISGNARTDNEQTQNILAGAQGVRDVLLQVSTNVGQMESGIQGISDNASQASVVATQAVELAQNTDGTMRKLADSSVDINNVIKLITSIAEQTNLLALNATIEAARAGDAGKGFAVVANEVKELAKETNKATDEIQRRVTAIRTETGHAVEAIGNINQIVSQIDGLQGNISESVRDQSSAVQAILSLIGNATKDNSTVRGILAEVLERQQSTQASAADVQRSSEVLRTGVEGNLQITRRYAS